MSQATNTTLQTILENTEVPHACYPPVQLLTLTDLRVSLTESCVVVCNPFLSVFLSFSTHLRFLASMVVNLRNVSNVAQRGKSDRTPEMIEGKSERCYKEESSHFKCFNTGPTKLLKFCCDWIFCIVTKRQLLFDYAGNRQDDQGFFFHNGQTRACCCTLTESSCRQAFGLSYIE